MFVFDETIFENYCLETRTYIPFHSAFYIHFHLLTLAQDWWSGDVHSDGGTWNGGGGDGGEILFVS